VDSKPLIVIPNYRPQVGGLPPVFPKDYVGYYQSAFQQIIVGIDFRSRTAQVCLSSDGYRPHHCRPGDIPAVIAPDSPEARWLSACWEAANALEMNVALENLFFGKKKAGTVRP
jgi:hypothetical protein